MKNKILLLNPPYKNDRIIREYNCSHTSKSSYIIPPLDLLVMSGYLSKDDVRFVDSVVYNLNYEKTFEIIKEIHPQVVISLTSVLSYKEDFDFLEKLKEYLDCKIFVLGDITYFKPKMIMKKFSFVDGIIFDFTSPFVINLIAGEYKGIKDIVYRKGKRIVFTKKSDLKEFSLPLPLHSIFPLKKYNLPYGRYKPFSSVLTSYGCPYKCSFCVSGKMHYKERDVDNFISELKYLKSIGVKEVFIRDTAFNSNMKRSKEICRKMIKNKLDFIWSCDMTSINCDLELLSLMKKAGCYLIMVGVETVDDKILKETRKPLTFKATTSFLGMCKKVGILTLGHFIFGLPNDTEKSINKTIEFAKKAGCDYASFNLYVPRIGSDLRNDLLKNNKIKKEDLTKLDCSTDCIEIGLPKERLLELKDKAIKEFYFRPSQIIKQILLIRTKTQLHNLIKNGYQIFLDALIKN